MTHGDFRSGPAGIDAALFERPRALSSPGEAAGAISKKFSGRDIFEFARGPKSIRNQIVLASSVMRKELDRRLPERFRCDARARIVDDDAYVTECTVVDLSRTGARLALPPWARIGAQFEFSIPSKGIE
jgi:hypothetical protein